MLCIWSIDIEVKMKKVFPVFTWLLPFSLIGLLILSLIWQEKLPLPQNDHEWISIFLIVLFFALVNLWIKKNPSEFLVNEKYVLRNRKDEQEKENEKIH
jgi:membrane protein CcdC involved in cytochrome C biogenesis